MEFKKFTSIENSYRGRFVNKFDSFRKQFIVREKLDGANIQLVFQPNQEMLVGKRTSFLSKEDSFFDIWNTLLKYKTELDYLQSEANRRNETYRIYGELYGPGINGRVDYGPEKKIAIFDAYVNDKLLTQIDLYQFSWKNNIDHLLPELYMIGFLDQCLAFDVENLPNRKDGEGVVIQPYTENIFSGNGERMILKKKAKKFEDTRQDAIDKGAGRAEPKEKDIIYDLNMVFRNYITENRVVDIFAKYGKISEMNQIGTYIVYVLEDAKVDFLKDNTIPEGLDKKQEKALYNVGGDIVQLLKRHL